MPDNRSDHVSAIAFMVFVIAMSCAGCAREPMQEAAEGGKQAEAFPKEAAPPAEAVTRPRTQKELRISFKLDPRLTKSIYMGERGVWPSTYTSTRQEGALTIEARATVHAADSRPVSVAPSWAADDPEMVTVSPSEGHHGAICFSVVFVQVCRLDPCR